MANIRDLKKDINYVLGDIIEAVYIIEASNEKESTKEGSAIIDGAIATFDELMAKVNQKGIEDKQAHFKSIRADLEKKARALVEKLNKL